MTSAPHALPPTPDQATPDQPTPPGADAGRPQLRRSRTDSMVGGVCGGLADYSGIDVLLWRIAFVGFTLAGGAGIVVYLLLWVLMQPAPLVRGEPQRPIDGLVDRLHAAATTGAARLRRN